MDLLLLLQAFGTSPSPDSEAYRLDLDGNGIINMVDFLEMLSQQPPIVLP